MAVALTALAVALGGSAVAATGGFADAGGVVQGCVTQSNIVRDVTGVVDAVTGNAIDPVTSGVNGVVDATKILTPKGTVLAVPVGETCPAGSTPQSLVAPAEPPALVGKAAALGDAKRTLASVDLPGGDYTFNGVVQILMPGDSSVKHTIKCALTGPDGETIPGTTSQATIDPHSAGEKIAMPMLAELSDLPAGELSGVCKDAAPPEPKPASGVRAAEEEKKPDIKALIGKLTAQTKKKDDS